MATIPTPDERYIKTLETVTLLDGRVVYKPSITKTIVGNSLTDLTIVANDHDRLDIMANNTYGSPMDWWRIASANNNVNGSIHLKPGTVLVIPQKT